MHWHSFAYVHLQKGAVHFCEIVQDHVGSLLARCGPALPGLRTHSAPTWQVIEAQSAAAAWRVVALFCVVHPALGS